ncbi:hypothetical protein J5N97_004349 [Dioscorea zingiberensis]|uniref:Protein NUCLEAR FUSION DEFECTIVE 6, chloroplastic/mitochondrial n=1 Tax=Dioscorea zingiberensis TaxID=325984 RepID=A0A9D5D6H1_9LILI|nr:hypothetical protein J5N97_004349 [Dioscorea zingiberensis]
MAAAAARSVFRSSSIRNMAARVSSETRAARSPLRLPKLQRPAPPRILRSPVEASFCVESLLPMHSVTALALMNSMLSVPGHGYGWLLEGKDETR